MATLRVLSGLRVEGCSGLRVSGLGSELRVDKFYGLGFSFGFRLEGLRV